MSSSKGPSRSLGPLSVGNVVSAAIRIYRDQFLVYYKLALIAYLWLIISIAVWGIFVPSEIPFLAFIFLIIPMYGWTKFMAISGLISRLAYQEVIASPETVTEARSNIQPRLCNFFLKEILVVFILFLFSIIFGYIFNLFFNPLNYFFWSNLNLISVISSLIYPLLYLLIYMLIYTWLSSRFLLAELPIAIEETYSPIKAVARIWKLTQGVIVRIIFIFFIAFIITIQILAIAQFLATIIPSIIGFILPIGTSNIGISISIVILSLIISVFGAAALLLPFWQIIKAVIYYDLRTRKEGIDLELRNS